jgi:hypothetical protein
VDTFRLELTACHVQLVLCSLSCAAWLDLIRAFFFDLLELGRAPLHPPPVPFGKTREA